MKDKTTLISEKMIRKAVERYQKQRNLSDKQLEEDDPQNFVMVLAEMLNTSPKAMLKRLMELGYLVDDINAKENNKGQRKF